MQRTARFKERIGAIFLPEAGPAYEEPVPGLDEPLELDPRLREHGKVLELPQARPPFDFTWPYRLCYTSLKQGCYTIGFTPSGTSILGTRYRGTLRIEHTGSGMKFSADLYAYRLLDDLVLERAPFEFASLAYARADSLSDDAADTHGAIPIYRRDRYRYYLKGTRSRLASLRPRGSECTFSLTFDQFDYNQPATGFSGSFNSTPDREVRWVMKQAQTPDLFTGEAFEGSTLLGKVSMRWISSYYRRAHLRLNTLEGADSPPTDVDGSSFTSIFSDTGWHLTVTDGGEVPLPADLSSVDINSCWSLSNYHTLMQSVPGYAPADLDATWRVHILAVPATLGCSRGWMFDTGGSNLNTIAREGCVTHSHDGYPANDCPDGQGGSHYDGAADQQQRDVPRAFLRSATHEVGHAFNQIHQAFEGGNDNSIMTPTPSVASVIGAGGTFPDDINLSFNETVKGHLRHLPDPAVRPGAMDFFGSAVSAPEPADVAWPETLAVNIALMKERLSLGEPAELTFTLSNEGDVAIPAPSTLDLESLIVRISVTDPGGRITFLRPAHILSCPQVKIVNLGPGKNVAGATRLFWGQDGFAFETPGRHLIEVIVLWDIAGVPVAAGGEQEVFVSYPTSDADNEVAALMLNEDVGRAIALNDLARFPEAAERIRRVVSVAPRHPATETLRRFGLSEAPRRRRGPQRQSE